MLVLTDNNLLRGTYGIYQLHTVPGTLTLFTGVPVPGMYLVPYGTVDRATCSQLLAKRSRESSASQILFLCDGG